MNRATLRAELVHQIGDTRRCPHCGHTFIPHDQTQEQAIRILKEDEAVTFDADARKQEDEIMSEIEKDYRKIPNAEQRRRADDFPYGTPPATTWQERVVQEKADLDARSVRLEKFLECDTVSTLVSADDFDLLVEQADLMKKLSHVLGRRIQGFTSTPSPAAPEPASGSPAGSGA